MKKKIFLLSLLIVVIISAPVFLYLHFRPTAKSTESEYQLALTSSTVTYSQFIDQIDLPVGEHVIFFYDEDKNSDYVINAVLTPLAYTEDSALPEMTPVSLKESKDVTVMQLKERFIIERTPSFIEILVGEDKSIKITSTLTHYDEDPITTESLQKWLVSIDQWFGPYDKD